jgi:hypothetical protein
LNEKYFDYSLGEANQLTYDVAAILSWPDGLIQVNQAA